MKGIHYMAIIIIFFQFANSDSLCCQSIQKTSKANSFKRRWDLLKKISNKIKNGASIINNKFSMTVKKGIDKGKKLMEKIKDNFENIWKSNGSTQNYNFDIHKKIRYFSIPLAKYFQNLAGYGYCNANLMVTNKCCSKFLKNNDWKLVAVEDFKKVDYNIGILISVKFKKIVITFPGTRGLKQLMNEFLNSGLKFFENSKRIKIVEYFNSLYNKTKDNIFKSLKKLQEQYPNYQYIFTGHSLGGAMATIFAFAVIKNRILEKRHHSPVLITYGQPRTGNDVFANEVMDKVPIIFRIVRQGDIVPTIPLCKKKNILGSICKSILNGYKFIKNLFDTRHETKSNRDHLLSGQTIKGLPASDYPWHIGGLILFNPDMTKYNDCGNIFGDNNPESSCHLNHSLNFDLHKFYIGTVKISEICNK